ncbi:hypothetical protein RJZ56_002273 [Blastomyces dermatitidis]
MSSSTINNAVIDKAFEDNAPLRKRVYSAIASTPEYTSLFEDIAKYTSTLRSGLGGGSSASSQLRVAAGEGPAAKKRKLIDGGVGDLSFAIPQRKKLRLELTRLAPSVAGGKDGYLRARNQASNEVEFGIPMSKIRPLTNAVGTTPCIEHILCLPVPEKTQRQFNFCILPEYGDGITTVPDDQIAFEPIVWTIPDGPPRTAFLGSGTPAMESANLAETYESYLKRMLDDNLRHTKVICPSEKEFVSPTPEAHRKGDKAYHVKAFRGSKEGFLFFLSTGIFFGFKKPLIFFSLENIDSISYTSVLQRTFNLNIAARSPLNPDEVQEFELSMIDQSNHPGIDAYIKKHGLQDASLAEARRAKRLNINGVKSGDDGADGAVGAGAGNYAGQGEEEEESELMKAQREMEDREEEEEEDYDPGSEGESEGSGSSSDEEDEDADGQGAYDPEEGRDLVREELGSEAEEI